MMMVDGMATCIESRFEEEMFHPRSRKTRIPLVLRLISNRSCWSAVTSDYDSKRIETGPTAVMGIRLGGVIIIISLVVV